MYAVPMIALNGILHRTLADRRVSSLEGCSALLPTTTVIFFLYILICGPLPRVLRTVDKLNKSCYLI
jgi:hypothetical protein